MAKFTKAIPEGDERIRNVCDTCGFVAYENPKIIVGSVVAADDGLLMCRRAIEPRRGFWTLPAGYMELGETPEEGAARESLEEARAVIAIEGLLAIFSVARIGQVQLIFRAQFADTAEPRFRPGPESLEVRLFRWRDIPWDTIAFPTVTWALNAWKAAEGTSLGPPAGNPHEDPRGMNGLAGPKGIEAT